MHLFEKLHRRSFNNLVTLYIFRNVRLWYSWAFKRQKIYSSSKEKLHLRKAKYCCISYLHCLFFFDRLRCWRTVWYVNIYFLSRWAINSQKVDAYMENTIWHIENTICYIIYKISILYKFRHKSENKNMNLCDINIQFSKIDLSI